MRWPWINSKASYSDDGPRIVLGMPYDVLIQNGRFTMVYPLIYVLYVFFHIYVYV